MKLKWELCRESEAEEKQFFPACVPGAVQLDWAAHKKLPDFMFGENYRQFDGLEDSFWRYKTSFKTPLFNDDERAFFVCGGIDYEFEIFINGEKLFYQEGAFTPVRLDITPSLRRDQKKNELEVLIYPAPKTAGTAPGREEADQSCKPAVNYGWDFCPRVIPLGIWDDCDIIVKNALNLLDAEVFYTLKSDLSSANVEIKANALNEEGVTAQVSILNPDGKTVYTGEKCDFIIENPELWWCAGHGRQSFYKWNLKIFKDGSLLDEKEGRAGFRKIELVMNEGAWDNKGYPTSRANPPITIQLNGKKIFAKGSNWVNSDVFPGKTNKKFYESLLKLARDANMNILRLWGGAGPNKESFYEICDDLGIMVWQEFPLSCNDYKGTEKYLEALNREAVSIIKRIRRHPCHVIWCGGNELFNGWSGMTDQSAALRLLNKLCYEQDFGKPFLMTSPLMGMGHGGYYFTAHFDNRIDVFELFQKSEFTAYTEFGVPCLADVKTLKEIIPEHELFPPSETKAWLEHHAFRVIWFDPGSWSAIDVSEKYFGKAHTLEELCERGALLQYEGYKGIFEEARRQAMRCSMAISWCFNEPWKTAANNSIISWPDRPKGGYEGVAKALRPVLASAKIPRFDFKPGSVFEAQLWILNDTGGQQKTGTVKAFLEIDEKRYELLQWSSGATSENLAGPTVFMKLPRDVKNRVAALHLECSNKKYNSSYRFIIKK